MIPALILIFAFPVYLGWRMVRKEKGRQQMGNRRSCPRCGAMVPPESISCIRCGRRLNSIFSAFRTDERTVMIRQKVFRFCIGFFGGLLIEMLLAAVILMIAGLSA